MKKNTLKNSTRLVAGIFGGMFGGIIGYTLMTQYVAATSCQILLGGMFQQTSLGPCGSLGALLGIMLGSLITMTLLQYTTVQKEETQLRTWMLWTIVLLPTFYTLINFLPSYATKTHLIVPSVILMCTGLSLIPAFLMTMSYRLAEGEK